MPAQRRSARATNVVTEVNGLIVGEYADRKREGRARARRKVGEVSPVIPIGPSDTYLQPRLAVFLG